MSHPSVESKTPDPARRSMRRILLLDCDMFFVQVARLEDPEGAGRAPLLVVGGSAEGRGVVTSADYSVREFGVHSGMPMARALELCPEAMAVPVPRKACVERSRAVRKILNETAPVVQAASIDEFYLDLTGTERLFRDRSLEEVGWMIRERVLAESEISVSVGGGTARMVAKLAAERAKPGGVHIVAPGREAEFLEAHPLAAIPGIGPALLANLRERGLERVSDVEKVDEQWLCRWFGEARGRWLWERCRGIDSSPVVAEDERKSISSERTFPIDLDVDARLETELLQISLSVGESLREKGLRARTVTVKIRDDDFRTRQGSRTLPGGLESDRLLFTTARELLRALREARRRPTRLLGVGVSGLEEADQPLQLGLFEDEASPEETERDRTLSHLGDELRSRFGRDALLPGRVLERGRKPSGDESPPPPTGRGGSHRPD